MNYNINIQKDVTKKTHKEVSVMNKQEFEERIGGEVRQSDYDVIEYVYTWHPAIRNTEGKDQIANLYKMAQMSIIKDMYETAQFMEKLDAERRVAENQLRKIKERIEDVVCGRLEYEKCRVDAERMFDVLENEKNWEASQKLLVKQYGIDASQRALDDLGLRR